MADSSNKNLRDNVVPSESRPGSSSSRFLNTHAAPAGQIAALEKINPTLIQMMAVEPKLFVHLAHLDLGKTDRQDWLMLSNIPRFEKKEDVSRNVRFLLAVSEAVRAHEVFDRQVRPSLPQKASQSQEVCDRGEAFVARTFLRDVLRDEGQAAFEATARLLDGVRQTTKERENLVRLQENVVSLPSAASDQVSSSHQRSVGKMLTTLFNHHLCDENKGVKSAPSGHNQKLYDSLGSFSLEKLGLSEHDFASKTSVFGPKRDRQQPSTEIETVKSPTESVQSPSDFGNTRQGRVEEVAKSRVEPKDVKTSSPFRFKKPNKGRDLTD